jgi:hypothetical protein
MKPKSVLARWSDDIFVSTILYKDRWSEAKIKTLWNETILARTSYNPLFTSLLRTTMMNQFPPSRVLESLHSNDITSSDSQSHEFLSSGKTILPFIFSIAQKFQYTYTYINICVCGVYVLIPCDFFVFCLLALFS